MSVDRVSLLRSWAIENGKGLEIGASHAPLFPKREGFDVAVLDYADANELRQKYIGLGIDISGIEEVDFVSDGRPIDEVVGDGISFDFIASSHAIEHVPDFVGYMQSCEKLLSPGGRAILAVPDKRFTFDAIHSPTTIGEVLEAHMRRADRHASGRVFDFAAGVSWLGALNSWNESSTGEIHLERTLAEAKEWFDRSMSGEYVDVHAWRFTPASFKLLMRDIRELNLCKLNVETLVSENVMEFFVCLSVDAEPSPLSRIDHVKLVMQEQIESNNQLLGLAADKVSGDHKEEPALPNSTHGLLRGLWSRLTA